MSDKLSDKMDALYGGYAKTIAKQNCRIADLERRLAEKQAEIDRLMLEFCPEEMTQEQKETWASHQKPAADEARNPK